MLRDGTQGCLSDAVLHPTLTAAISGVEKKNFSNIDVMLSIFLCEGYLNYHYPTQLVSEFITTILHHTR